MFMDSSGNPVLLLQQYGQSVWLNELQRRSLRKLGLTRLMEDDGLSGIAPLPLNLKAAIPDDVSYEADILRNPVGAEPIQARQIYEQIILQDTRDAADAFRGIFERSEGRYGIVCMPCLSPTSSDPGMILEEARRIWQALDRPNVMATIPASASALPALGQLIAEGISVNVTCLCGVKRYAEVLEAIASALEERVRAGRSVNAIASLAGFCIREIDAQVDAELTSIRDTRKAAPAHELLGKAGTAIGCFAYQELKKFAASPRGRSLAANGAKPQRLLWMHSNAGSHVKEDLRNIDALIGTETISAVSLATLEEYRRHGRPRPTLEANLYETATLASELSQLGIDLESVGDRAQSGLLREFAAIIDASVDEISAQRTAS